MAVSRRLPYLACNFQVRWSPGEEPPAETGFSEVLLPAFAAGAVTGSGSGTTGGELAAGDRAAATVGIPTAVEPGGGSGAGSGAADGSDAARLVLRRGFSGSLEVYRWWNETRLGKGKGGRTVEVALLDGERGDVVCTWTFASARPEQLSYSPLQALESSVMIETLTLSYDTMTMK